MDYQPPTLCIRSITEAESIGRFMLDMPSLWVDDGPVEVDETTINYVSGQNNLRGGEGYAVPTCPPGYPNPPAPDSDVPGDTL